MADSRSWADPSGPPSIGSPDEAEELMSGSPAMGPWRTVTTSVPRTYRSTYALTGAAPAAVADWSGVWSTYRAWWVNPAGGVSSCHEPAGGGLARSTGVSTDPPWSNPTGSPSTVKVLDSKVGSSTSSVAVRRWVSLPPTTVTSSRTRPASSRQASA